MARATVATQTADQDGGAVTFAAASVDGASIEQGATLLVKNDSGSTITVTVQTPETRAGLAVTDATGTVATGTIGMFGNLPAATFVRPSGATDPDRVWVDFSAVTSVTIAAVA